MCRRYYIRPNSFAPTISPDNRFRSWKVTNCKNMFSQFMFWILECSVYLGKKATSAICLTVFLRFQWTVEDLIKFQQSSLIYSGMSIFVFDAGIMCHYNLLCNYIWHALECVVIFLKNRGSQYQAWCELTKYILEFNVFWNWLRI